MRGWLESEGMRYSLRTLQVLLILGPPVLAATWYRNSGLFVASNIPLVMMSGGLLMSIIGVVLFFKTLAGATERGE